MLLRLTELWTGRTWAPKAQAVIQNLPRGRILAVLAALNWIYLCFNLPK